MSDELPVETHSQVGSVLICTKLNCALCASTDAATLREEVLRSAYDRLVLQNDRIDNRCTQLKKELFEKSTELDEATSEIARHHELITWMRDNLEAFAGWAINDIDPVEGQERREHIRSRLNREVSND